MSSLVLANHNNLSMVSTRKDTNQERGLARIEESNEIVKYSSAERELQILRRDNEAYKKILNSNKVTKRRAGLYHSFRKIDDFKKHKPKNIAQRFYNFIKNKVVSVKAIKETGGYNMSDTTLRNDLNTLCKINVLQRNQVGRSYNYEVAC